MFVKILFFILIAYVLYYVVLFIFSLVQNDQREKDSFSDYVEYEIESFSACDILKTMQEKSASVQTINNWNNREKNTPLNPAQSKATATTKFNTTDLLELAKRESKIFEKNLLAKV